MDSRTRSRRASFVGGKSITDSSALPVPDAELRDGQNIQESSRMMQKSTTSKPPVELSEEELAARAAFEAIYEMKHPGKAIPDMTNLDTDELHEYLASFGLLSREALRDGDLKINVPNLEASNIMGRSTASPFGASSSLNMKSPASPQQQHSSVAKGDFVEFLTKHDHLQKLREREKRKGSTAWIDFTVERHTAAIAKAQQQQQQQQLHQTDSSSFLDTMNNNTSSDHHQSKTNIVSVVDLASDDGDASLRDGEHGHGDHGNGEGDGYYSSAQHSEETLAAIEKRLKEALEARANSPIPAMLKTDHELRQEQLRLNRSRGSITSNSPEHHSPSPHGGRRSRPRNHSSSPGGRSASSSHHHNNNTSSASASSPSAVLRKHQQAQLQALLEIRRNGGSMLAARSAKNNNNTSGSSGAVSPSVTMRNSGTNRRGGGRRTPSTLAGYTVVNRK